MENNPDSLGDYVKSTNTDQLTIAQVEEIRSEISANQPIIGKEENVECLAEKYKESPSPGFIPGILYLSKVFHSMRQVRGDGNCFYRAVLFGYLENLLRFHLSEDQENVNKASTELARFTEIIRGSLQDLVALGYPEYVLESFTEV